MRKRLGFVLGSSEIKNDLWAEMGDARKRNFDIKWEITSWKIVS